VRKLLLISTLLCASAHAAVINAASLSSADVQAALDSAGAGDTVVLPAGAGTWSSIVYCNPFATGLTIRGAGTSVTGGGDQTVITDNVVGSPMLAGYIAATGVMRITGITFTIGTGSSKDTTIGFNGPGTMRIDHCTFNMVAGGHQDPAKAIQFNKAIYGVMDSCILNFKGLRAIYFFNGRDNGDGQGNYEWSLPTEFGGPNYFFIEDNIINGIANGSTYETRIFDGYTAAKVVVRFNTVSQAVLGETHGTGHSGDDRGLRSQEIYGNSVTSSLGADPNYCAIDLGNGTGLVWGNTWNEVYKIIYLFKQTRKNNSTYPQIATPGGWGYAGTEFNGTGSMWDGGTALGTDAVKGYPVLDQVGRGQGDLITGTFAAKINNATGTIYWPNQALEPVYIWNNPGANAPGWGSSVYNDDTGGRVVANRDYYPSASGIQTTASSPFDGTVGTGWGTLANRPTTCTTGVAYFATDQGSWNGSTSNPYGVQQNGADGVLYKATATNTWTLYYTPYTYPHPLRDAAGTYSPTGGGARAILLSR
jgi:hypothetical protein